ncbi:MAG: class I SAM-dependent methyltransferase [Myxococcales bacterium]|nr:class I SAM-dependent methyltransferase [Myxococcales bacterium]
MARKRSHKMEKLARIYDTEILPVWSHRFGRMLLRELDVESGAQVLDVACGTGYPSTEIVRRMPKDSRLIAIDDSAAMLDVARTKIEEMGARNVFFRSESAVPKLSFADDVYDMVVCNLGLSDFADPQSALIDFARVTRPGGEVRCTLPLAGTFQEFLDIYQEVLTKHDKHETLATLQKHVELALPDVDQCYQWLENAGLEDVTVEIDEFAMLFKSSREFFFAPLIEFGPIADWKRIAGKGQEMQDIFWYIKEAIDAYYSGRAFEVTVKAGLIRGRVPLQAPPKADTEELTTLDIVKRENPALVRQALKIDDDAQLDAFIEGSARPDHLK